MNIDNLLQGGGDAVLLVKASDLKDFALSLMDAARNEIADSGNEELLTPSEFCLRNRVSKATVWRWVKAGVLKPTKIGGKVFYKQSDLKTNF